MSDKPEVETLNTHSGYNARILRQEWEKLARQIMLDVELRKWCIVEARGGGMTAAEIFAFVTAGLTAMAPPDDAA